MTPYLYEKTYHGTGNSDRIGPLPAWIECLVTEERNGEFYLEGTLPSGAENVDQLAIDRIIMAAPSPARPAASSPFSTYLPMQPFRIRRLYKDADSDMVHVLAHHVTYQLIEYQVKPSFSRSYSDIQDFLDEGFNESGTLSNFVVPAISGDFHFLTNIELLEAVQISHTDPLSPRAWIGGDDGLLSILTGKVDAENEVLKEPEVDWNGWTVEIKKFRGANRGISVSYGHNLASLEYDTDAAGLVTGYFGWWRKDGFYTDSVIYESNASDWAYPRVVSVDLSNVLSVTPPATTPTDAAMEAALQAYAKENKANFVPTCITVNAVPDILQNVYLCDTIKVVHPVYKIKQSAKIVRTVYDPIHDRYASITIGEIQKGITDTIARMLARFRT